MRRTTVRLSDEARRGWDKVRKQHGVSLTALMEAIGQTWDERPAQMPDDILDAARTVDDERRTRPK